MSCDTTFSLPVDRVVIPFEFQPEQFLNLKQGDAFNEVWSLKLFKKPRKRGNCAIILFIERQKGNLKIMTTIKLVFIDLPSNEYLGAKFVRTFKNEYQTKSSFHLNKQICQMFSESKTIHITGKILFRRILDSEHRASSQTLTTLSTDLRKMCFSNIFSDVTLRCGSEVFSAHKVILAARCPKFGEMLKKIASDDVKIVIDDLTPHVLKAILLFIYSGEVENLTFQSACDLLSACDKYYLTELKTLCIHHITASFSVENVLDFFHKYEGARNLAQEFITEHFSEIKRTEQWENFKRDFPDLVLVVKQESS